jgi:DNA primase
MIDRATIEKIKDAANIVDVVGEFVTLRKSGANYKGLCPFHNEKTPSFYVSPARGTCHCFGCGKGGNPISFIMEHEQMTYPEALRWLANKYHIEIKERELSDEEKREQSERESMFIVNEWAAGYFQDILHNHVDGVAIGMQYFRQRGFRDDIIKKFQLGFDLTDRFALANAARGKGYKDEFLLKTGICYKTERGELIDRYAGRVMFPWIGVSGKVVGFGGRLLDSRTKGVNQKYVNSPESDIYHKDHELYGIYQAKKAIAKEDLVYMVEGYTDVISMHQCGIENVVANSGTALSIHQIHTLHRFTSNIVLLYDGDAAGIHAAMRGTDMLLSEGMNLKVMLLPDNDDPDSFARKHTAADFRKYIEEHQTDFIQFKTNLLLNGVTDPTKRTEAIQSIIKSISVIQNQILRDTYLHDCVQRLGVNEAVLINEMNKMIRADREQLGKEAGRAPETIQAQKPSMPLQPSTPMQQASKVEKMLIQMVIRHGEVVIYENVEDEEGNVYNLSIAQFIDYNLSSDGLSFHNELYSKILSEAVAHHDDSDFVAEQYFIHHPDIEISKLASAMSVDRYQLINSPKKDELPKTAEELRQEKEGEIETLRQQTLHLILDFRMDYVEHHLKELQQQISLSVNEPDKLMKLMAEFKEMQQIRNALAKKLGNDIIV